MSTYRRIGLYKGPKNRGWQAGERWWSIEQRGDVFFEVKQQRARSVDGWVTACFFALWKAWTCSFLKVHCSEIAQKKRPLKNFWKMFSEFSISATRWRHGAKRAKLFLAFLKVFRLKKCIYCGDMFWPEFRRASFGVLTRPVGGQCGSQRTKSPLRNWKMLTLQL